MDFDNSAQVDALAKLPPEPPKPPERSAWSVVPRAITSGAGKIGAAIVEGVAAMSPSEEELRRNPGRTAFSAEDLGLTARSARDFERTLRPDPATAGTAEQLVYGLGSGLTQAGIGALVAGPFGAAAALGGGEGATVTDDLQRQGVDDVTARMAGGVTGAVNAASVALPMFGPTLKATAGLYLAGGPGGFMAQQALTSQILERAGYAKIAEQFDPLDPLGLTLSALVPLPFAAWGAARNIRTAKALKAGEAPPVTPAAPEAPTVPREAVDAAMVHNLTLQRQAQESMPFPMDDAPPPMAPVDGAQGVVITERGMQVPIRYRVVEADTLVTSHGNDLTANPAFPQELQPRDRGRAASADQIARIENAIRPELLGESVKASDGAPIIGPDAVVESGNARTIALRRAYESGKADGYGAWLSENAARFGVDPAEIAGMRRPVLVRERMGDIDRAEFTRQANESPIAALSPVEQARADSARMSDLSGLVANDDGTINMGQSRDWLRGFMRGVAATERGAMMQADGQLSQAGMQRIRNAVFAKAYGDPEILAALSESTNSNIRNILAGLLRAAPDVARLQDLIAAGARQPMDFAPDLVRAARELGSLRDRGINLDTYLAQGDLAGGGLTPEMNNLLVGLSENARSPRRVAEMVRAMVDTVDALGDPRQASMFGDAGPTRGDVAADAIERVRTLTDAELTNTPPETIKPAPDALTASVTERVAAVEATNPDMPIGMTEDGKPITVRDELARIRKEAFEGTDTELGATDADLVNVAANCALTNGG
jgi:hypothetical protein